MNTFRYIGRSLRGKRVRGIITADGPRTARELLRKREIRIERLETAGPSWLAGHVPGLHRLRFNAVNDFLRELTSLLQAGVSLVEALDSVVLSAPRSLRRSIEEIRDQVATGADLSDAMQGVPGLFDGMTVGMIRVGEAAGNLDVILDHLTSYREKASRLRDHVLSAMLYPAFVLVFSMAVTIFLMTVVVPPLLENLVEMGGKLPWPTRVLAAFSRLLLQWGGWLFAFGAIVFVLFAVWLRTDRGKAAWEAILFRLPVIGKLALKQHLARVASVLTCLLRSGIELVSALEITARTCDSLLLAQSIREICHDLEQGTDLMSAFSARALIPDSVARMFALGQKTGKLDTMLERLSNDYEHQVEVLAKRLTHLLEPVLIILLAVVVGFIMFATILPILQAGSTMTSQ